MNNKTYIAIAILIILTAFLTYFVFSTKYTCKEGSCEFDINGEFSSKKQCEEKCNIKNKLDTLNSETQNDTNTNDTDNTDSDSDDSDSDNDSQPDDEQQLNAWACTNDYQCVKAEQGYTSKNLCELNCNKPITTYYPYTYSYYPQSLYYRTPWNYRTFRPYSARRVLRRLRRQLRRERRATQRLPSRRMSRSGDRKRTIRI